MSGPILSASNKIGCLNSAFSLRAGVHGAGGGGGAGENRSARCLVGRSRPGFAGPLSPIGADVQRISRTTENQALSGQRLGGVASPGVASRGFLVRSQALRLWGRLIASFPTGAQPGDLELADRRDQARATGGLAPRPGAARDHLPGSPRQSPRAKCAATGGSIPPQSTVKAQQGLKNREDQSGTNGVGGSRSASDARKARLKRLFSSANSRPGRQNWGRGYASRADLGWRNPARLCAGVRSVN